jgi:alkanesulfonate monooxygenase SsuD/methylene tetrahydromethanopterin reductase-like flavin-dependent oxidoreductase (luciferase family)
MWAGDEQPYHGKHYSLERPLNSPTSVQRPHPPIMIGGGGEQKTLRLVARYADACNVFGDAEGIAHKYAVLRERCEEEGRPYEEIERSTLQRVDLAKEEPAEVVERFGRLADAGAQHIIFNFKQVSDSAQLERLLRALEPLRAA